MMTMTSVLESALTVSPVVMPTETTVPLIGLDKVASFRDCCARSASLRPCRCWPGRWRSARDCPTPRTSRRPSPRPCSTTPTWSPRRRCCPWWSPPRKPPPGGSAGGSCFPIHCPPRAAGPRALSQGLRQFGLVLGHLRLVRRDLLLVLGHRRSGRPHMSRCRSAWWWKWWCSWTRLQMCRRRAEPGSGRRLLVVGPTTPLPRPGSAWPGPP